MNSAKYAPPWREPYFIGVAGCSGSGKTSITRELIGRLNVPWTVLLSMDNFYRPLNLEQRQLAFKSELDFDRPEVLDFDLLLEVLQKLKRGERTEVPIYSFKDHNRTNQSLALYGANVVIIEGIYTLYDQRILDLLDLKVFVHEDYDVCMARRLHRDILYRGRDLELSIKQWHKFVKPNYLTHILPTAKSANLLVPRGIENDVAIAMLFAFVKRQLRQKSEAHLKDLRKLGSKDTFCREEFDSIDSWAVQLMPTNQVRALQTVLADDSCDRESFIHSVDRLARKLLTEAMNVVWTESNERICAATMVRGGECFESALRQLLPEVYLGRLLILSDSRTGEPKLHMSRLPAWLSEDPSSRVILTEAQIISGAATVMAITVLVDHGVKEENIVFCAFLASEIGVRRIHAAFPNVHLIVGEIISPPQMMNLDSRYYGTK